MLPCACNLSAKVAGGKERSTRIITRGGESEKETEKERERDIEEHNHTLCAHPTDAALLLRGASDNVSKSIVLVSTSWPNQVVRLVSHRENLQKRFEPITCSSANYYSMDAGT